MEGPLCLTTVPVTGTPLLPPPALPAASCCTRPASSSTASRITERTSCALFRCAPSKRGVNPAGRPAVDEPQRASTDVWADGSSYLPVLLGEGLEGHVPHALGDAHELDVEGVAQRQGVVLAGQPQTLHPDGHLYIYVCVCVWFDWSVGTDGVGRVVKARKRKRTSPSISSITCCSSSGWMCDSAASTPSAPALACGSARAIVVVLWSKPVKSRPARLHRQNR